MHHGVLRENRAALLIAALLVLAAAAEALYILHMRPLDPAPPPASRSPVAQPATPAPPRPPAIESPYRGSLQERQMSRGVYIAAVRLEDLVRSEAAFFEGLRLLRDYLESRDRRRLEKALAAFQATNEQPLNRFRRYSFYYQAWCQERLGSTSLKDLYVSKGWIAPDLYEYFFAGDLRGMTRHFLKAFCEENEEALREALDLYARDHGGGYPERLEALVPRYINRIPRCPACDVDTYSAAWRDRQGGEPPSPLCDRHGEGLPDSLSGSAAASPPTDPGGDEGRFYVYWAILEDYAEQHRFATWLQLLVAASNLEAGDVVADIGCGRGLFTFALARQVGPRGKVYAVDINQGALDFIDFALRKHPGPKIQTVLGKEDDVRLPGGSLDAAYLVAVYHNLLSEDAPRDPERLRTHVLPWLRSIHRALKPGGTLLVQDGRIDPEIVREQVVQAGFEYLPEKVLTPKLEDQTLTVFRKTTLQGSRPLPPPRRRPGT